MSTESSLSPLTHSFTISSQLSQPVHVAAAPGLSESDFRRAVESTLLKQWLKNLQSETETFANGDVLLKQVLIQVPGIVSEQGSAVAVLILLDSEGESYAILTEQVVVVINQITKDLSDIFN